MKKIMGISLVVSIFTFGILAANLKNQDSKKYEIKIIGQTR